MKKSKTSKAKAIVPPLEPSLNSSVVPPLFILAPPRCFTSIVCAMLGQHPQMYGLPETLLFTAETIRGLWGGHLHAAPRFRHGLQRAVAQLFFGEQTEASIQQARGWLRRRASFTTGFVFELLAAKVYPRIVVEKSPPVTFRLEAMQRMLSMFPQARFLHLLRHPRGHGESNIKYGRQLAQEGKLPATHWIFYPAEYPDAGPHSKQPRSAKVLDPQRGWLLHNMNICKFLRSVPETQQLQVRGEALLRHPDDELRRITAWLGIRTDAEAIEEMKHPERWPYAFVGPPSAPSGSSLGFLEQPALRPYHGTAHSLEGPLSWREDGRGFLPGVKKLAQQFGYE